MIGVLSLLDYTSLLELYQKLVVSPLFFIFGSKSPTFFKEASKNYAKNSTAYVVKSLLGIIFLITTTVSHTILDFTKHITGENFICINTTKARLSEETVEFKWRLLR